MELCIYMKITNEIKKYILKKKKEINLNDWKSVLLNIEADDLNVDDMYYTDIGYFSYSLINVLRDADINVDKYISQVFEDYPIYKVIRGMSEGDILNNLEDWTISKFNIYGEGLIFKDLINVLNDLCKRHSNMNIYESDNIEFESIIPDKGIEVESYIRYVPGNSYLIYSMDFYYKGDTLMVLDNYYSQDGGFGRIIYNYGLGIDMQQKEDVDELIISKLKDNHFTIK